MSISIGDHVENLIFNALRGTRPATTADLISSLEEVRNILHVVIDGATADIVTSLSTVQDKAVLDSLKSTYNIIIGDTKGE